MRKLHEAALLLDAGRTGRAVKTSTRRPTASRSRIRRRRCSANAGVAHTIEEYDVLLCNTETRIDAMQKSASGLAVSVTKATDIRRNQLSEFVNLIDDVVGAAEPLKLAANRLNELILGRSTALSGETSARHKVSAQVDASIQSLDNTEDEAEVLAQQFAGLTE